ncbi:LysR family transcriptional regulator [Klebsiella pneumoniae]|nr:LysR family transcriptional regulator [Klebsiella pneumoniae]
MLKRKHDKIYNIMQLRFFCQVALRGSVSRAADDLFRTPVSDNPGYSRS